MSKFLDSKNCIVTGAGKGIGKDIANLFNVNGANLALITRSKEDVKVLENELNQNSKHLIFHGDVSDKDTVQDFVSEAIKKYKKIDVLVNNAGMRFRKSFPDISYDEYMKVIETNLGSVFLMSKEVIPNMVENNGGSIINMSSIAGTLGLSDLSAYISSKSAILGLTKSLAVEFAEKNLKINAIAPGFIETSYFEDFKDQEELYKFTLERTPMNRWGKSNEIAQACLFLASDMSSFITGETLNIDGGWSAW
tara:strand:+ start:1751 stop:2503 length:753 start_codon:yes stop_codon:yes gene_type:complete